ncbi:TadE/TadG family type IV pilus assembly protein [Burkholderia sp. 22PA0106]|uniref:TadE/TadG family type IV pilus assembly protein n=1 Tax=Burkholderia sp. 22PA0106 TaxID=3237371 RepID=UPI0039C0F4EC
MSAHVRTAACRARAGVRHTWRRVARRFGASEHGLSTLEFAILAPGVFILMLGIIEFGLDLMADASVQYAAQQASRAGITTLAPSSGTREQAASQTVTTILQPWTRIGATVTLTISDYGTFTNGSPATGSAGGLGDVVAYNVRLSFPNGFTGLLTLFGVSPLVFSRNYLVQNEK